MITEVDEHGTMRRLGTTAEVAQAIGASVNEVRNWYRRRELHAFPEARGVRLAPNGMRARYWDLDEVLAWSRTTKRYLKI